MPLNTPGDTLRVGDFINEAEADPTPANDVNKSVKLEIDAKISNKFTRGVALKGIVGEDIDASVAPKAVFIHDGGNTETDIVNSDSDNSTTNISIGVAERFAQPILNTVLDFITEVKWECAGSGVGLDDNLYVELFAVDGNNFPTGSALASKVFNSNTFDNAGSICVFDTPVAVTRNTNYAVVIRASTSDSGDTYIFNRRTVNPGSAFPDEIKYHNGSWADSSGYARNFYVKGYQSLDEGKLYKSDKDIVQRNKIDGFITKQDLEEDEEAYVYLNVMDGFTGLDAGQNYYIENDGDITNTGSVLAGKALSATEIRILKSAVMPSAELIWEYSADSNVDMETYTAQDYGFVFGNIRSTGSGADLIFNGINGETFTHLIPSTGSVGTSFCFPVIPGDEVSIDGNDLQSKAYFRRFSV